MAEPTTTAALAEARTQALEEATAEARRLAAQWRSEADEPHSSHQADLRRTWAEAADKVAEAIVALAQQAKGPKS